MPEGPEVRLAAARIARALGGDPLEGVHFGLDALRGQEARLVGRRLLAADTRGKAFLLRFEGEAVLYVHLQLYGRWTVVRRGASWASARQLRVALEGPRQVALLYSATDVALLEPAALAAHPYLTRLGPDLLDPATTPAQVAERAASPAFAGRRLQGLLLDQGFLAGVGNYLRSEILFEAGLSPTARPKDLDPAARGRLGQAAVEVGARALAHPGVTTPWPVAQALKAQGLPRREYRHQVFGRAGQPCRRCSAVIHRIEAAGRRLYLCPRCQAA